MKRIYEFGEMMALLESAEELGFPYKLIKTTEPRFNELTEKVQLSTVWMFKFLEEGIIIPTQVVRIQEESDEDDK